LPDGEYHSRTMSQRKIPPFAHRHNPDGSWDTICSLCVITVAHEKIESDLIPHELTHTCDPARLDRFAQELVRKDW
jgi:hypothetical protein